MIRFALAASAFLLGITGVLAATVEDDFKNYLYFNGHLNHVRKAHDRMIISGDPAVFSTILDLRYGSSVDGDKMPGMWGFGSLMGNENFSLGCYALLYSTDLGSSIVNLASEGSRSMGYFYETSAIGLSVAISRFLLAEIDWTFALGQTYLYTRFFIPFINTSFGIGVSPFDTRETQVDGSLSNLVFINTNVAQFNVFRFETGALRFVNLGLDIFRNRKLYSPFIQFSAHQVLPPDWWVKLPADLIIDVKADIEVNLPSIRLISYDVRAKLWFFPFKEWGFGDQSGRKMLIARGGFYAAVSYVPPAPGSTVTEPGKSGLGYELGIGMLTMENMGLGLKSDLLTFCWFANYSEYFESVPVITQGFKFLFYI